MRTLSPAELASVSGGNFLTELGKAIVQEVIIEGGKALGAAMNEHAQHCNQVIHDDPSSRGRALL